VADLDADGSPEVVAMVETWNNKTLYVYAFHADGSPVEGFPATVFTSSPTTLTSYTNFELSLKDLNHDGYVEIILNSPANNFNQVYILDHTGQSLPGWPQTIDGYRVLQVYAADMTGDAKENIIVYYMANNISGSTAKIAVYDLAGEILPNYPQIAANQVARMGLGIADVTQDGIPDIVLPHYGVGSTQFACSPSVFTQSGIFPYPINCYHGNDVPPAIADFDADDIPEVIVSSISQAKIYILQQQIDNSGKMGWYSTWEKSISDSFTQPIVADIDHNGHYEIMTVATNSQTTSDGTLLLWEPTDITNTAGIDSWPQYRHDAAHTSLYSHQISLLTPSPASPPAPGDANFDGHVDILDYSVIISNFGIDSSPNCSTRPPGDIAPYPDGNCVVDILDYSLVISTFGSN
jgi:hypothetical protein